MSRTCLPAKATLLPLPVLSSYGSQCDKKNLPSCRRLCEYQRYSSFSLSFHPPCREIAGLRPPSITTRICWGCSTFLPRIPLGSDSGICRSRVSFSWKEPSSRNIGGFLPIGRHKTSFLPPGVFLCATVLNRTKTSLCSPSYTSNCLFSRSQFMTWPVRLPGPYFLCSFHFIP